MGRECIVCGGKAQSRTRDGAWLCRDCVKRLGGYGGWGAIWRMSTEEIMRATNSETPEKITKVEIERVKNSYTKTTWMSVAIFMVCECQVIFVSRFHSIQFWIAVLGFAQFLIVILATPSWEKKRIKELKEAEENRRQARIYENAADNYSYIPKYAEPASEYQYRWVITDQMTGIQFEQYCAMELKRDHGFVRVEMTKTSGDYGGDLVAYHVDGSKWVIQCKRYSGHVGIDAVQEVLGAQAMYDADRMAVMTNNVLTASAMELARKTGVVVKENIKGSMRID